VTEPVSSLLQWLAAGATLAGSLIFLAGAIAVIRLPDFFTRMHGPTKSATLGLMLIGTGAMLRSVDAGSAHWVKDLILVIFIFVTAPVSAQILMRAACVRRTDQTGTARGVPPTYPVELVERSGELTKDLLEETAEKKN